MILQAIVVLLRVVGLLLLVRMVLRALTGRAGGAPPRRAGSPPPKVISDLVRDQVCNTFVPRERAVRAVISGREEHFCSSACRDRALSAATHAS